MRVLLAIVIAVGTLVLSVVAQALADPPTQLSPTQLSPQEGATFTAGVGQITFRAFTTTAPAPAELDFYVSRDPDLDANGVLANWFDDIRGLPIGGDPPVYEGAPDQDAGWPNKPGTYYWQAVNAGCHPNDCESPVRSLTVIPAPESLVSQGKVELDTFLTDHPRHRTHKRKVTFAFSSDVNGASFQCFYAQGWAKCRSPHTFRHLKPGRYRFQVRAIVNGVKDPTPASWTFRILR